MRICVVGTGYVGLVAGTCFADGGSHVTCVDNDQAKIDRLLAGDVPIYEPGLAEIIQRNVKAGRLTFTTDLAKGVADSLLVFLAVGTPMADDGSADLATLLSVARQVAELMDDYRIIVTKSTVPVGTHKVITDLVASVTKHPFDYVSNPEFMKEGAAIDDFTSPDRVVIGATNPAVVAIMRQIYAPFMRQRDRMLVMDPASAEMTKYAANAMLATKVSFMNEMACLCEAHGADVEMVRKGIGSDSRIGYSFIFPGVGYGGSCFPKDVSAIIHMGNQAGSPMTVCQAVEHANQRQRQRFAQRIISRFASHPSPVTVSVWGLAFKARTDDVRESPAIGAIRELLDHGMIVRAHDPEAMANTRRELGDTNITYHDDTYNALDGADALVIFTDWQEFRVPDFDEIARRLTQKLIFDGRNLYDPALMTQAGFEYHCIGRPTRTNDIA